MIRFPHNITEAFCYDKRAFDAANLWAFYRYNKARSNA